MDRLIGHMTDIHNISLVDRIVRFFTGGVLLFIGVISIVLNGHTELWEAIAILLAIYPLMTCVMGWDPIYHVLDLRTGADNTRNVTGTIPYQVDAAMGNNPVPDKNYEYDHSLPGSHLGIVEPRK